jgi:hypothetical protein
MLKTYFFTWAFILGLTLLAEVEGQEVSESSEQFRAAWSSSGPGEFLEAWRKRAAEEQSLFSVEELRQIFLFLRSEVATDYSINYRFFVDVNDIETLEERRFARSSNKFLSTRKPIRGGATGYATSYDGSLVRHCQTTGLHSIASKSDKLDYGSLIDINGDVVVRSMLFDLVETLHSGYPYHDIQVFLSDQQATEEIWIGGDLTEIAGQECFVISRPLYDVWVCPALNFAVCRICEFDIEAGKVVELKTVEFSDFHEVKEGIFVPYRMDSRDNRRTEVVDVHQVGLSENGRTEVVEVTQYLPDYEFGVNELESVIPQNAIVRDQINNSVSMADRESSVEEMLDFSLSQLRGTKIGAKPKDEVWNAKPLKYKQACGPISCYVALNWLAPGEFSLKHIADQLSWSEGETISFASLFNFLHGQEGYQCQLVRISPEQLAATLTAGKRVAVLPVRAESTIIDHSVCAVAGEDGHVMLIDYPNLAQPISFSELSRIWDGEAIVMSKLDADAIAPMMTVKAIVLAAIIVALLVWGLILFGRPGKK